MNSIEKLLADFPEELTAFDVASALACTLKEAEQMFEQGHLSAKEVDGAWQISKASLIAQLHALKSPANAA